MASTSPEAACEHSNGSLYFFGNFLGTLLKQFSADTFTRAFFVPFSRMSLYSNQHYVENETSMTLPILDVLFNCPFPSRHQGL